MISADTGELERVYDEISSVASRTDDVLNSLKRILSEIQDDIDLNIFPQYVAVCDAVALSVAALNRGNDILQTLKGILARVSEEYEENEAKSINAIGRMTIMLSNIQASLSSAALLGAVTVEYTAHMQTYERARELIDEHAEDLQVTNIAAVERIVSEEYAVNHIEDMSSN